MIDLRSIHREERKALLATLEAVGQEAPTLCSGWTSRHIAAHIVSAERMGGLPPALLLWPIEWVLPVRLARRFRGPVGHVAQRELARADKRGWLWLQHRLEAGPPIGARLPWAQPLVLLDQWVHHEDIRRANGMGPRSTTDEVREALIRLGRSAARFPYIRNGRGSLEAVTPDGERLYFGHGEARIRVTGEPGELLLFVAGRRSAARVDVEADDADLAKLIPSLRV